MPVRYLSLFGRNPPKLEPVIHRLFFLVPQLLALSN